MSSDKKIAKIFAHDAGGANALFAYAFQLKKQGYNIKAYPDGPAVKIFEANIPEMIDKEPPTFNKQDTVIAGSSGFHSTYELRMIKAAKKNGVRRTISVLDMPYNICERFKINGKIVDNRYLPHEIWVPKIIEKEKPKNKNITKLIIEKKNPYWSFLKKQRYSKPPLITNYWVKKYKNSYLLYVADYIKEQYGSTFGYTEYSLLRDFLTSAKRAGFTKPIFIKLHPREEKDKYVPIINKFPQLRIKQIDCSLQELIYYSRAIFGWLSSVFFEAALINKPTYSLQIGAKKFIEAYYTPDSTQKIDTKEDLERNIRKYRL